MKICITAQTPSENSPLDPRFGRAKCFMIYDDVADTWETLDNDQNLHAAQGAGIQAASQVVNAGCGALISGHCGPKAYAALSRANVAVYPCGEIPVKEALEAFKQGELKKIENADVEGHW
jgi:predicted Fe-Mo cluster-binding NifX family protein